MTENEKEEYNEPSNENLNIKAESGTVNIESSNATVETSGNSDTSTVKENNTNQSQTLGLLEEVEEVLPLSPSQSDLDNDTSEKNYNQRFGTAHVTGEGIVKASGSKTDNLSAENVESTSEASEPDLGTSPTTSETEQNLKTNKSRVQSDFHMSWDIEGEINYANSTPIKTDGPSLDDALNRKPFAKYLAKRLGKLWKQINIDDKVVSGKSFVIHLYSEWGAGKSTFLNLLKKELDEYPVNKDNKWITLEFNAWQNQHIEPAWWSLLNSIYAGITNKESGLGVWRRFTFNCREYLWRYISSKYILTLPIFLFLLAIILSVYALDLSAVTTIISSAFVLISSSVGVALKSIGSLFAGSPKSAKVFEEMTSDPMSKVKEQFNKNINFINNPVIVFIDDLDRCRESYVVSLLESLHTLFNHRQVIYIVAADKKWISSCFHNSYSSIAEHIEDQAKPTGHLFIEKLFQVSIGLPAISKKVQKDYLDILLNSNKPEKFDELSIEENELLQNARKYSDFNKLDTSNPKILENVILKSIEDDFDTDVEHRLKNYVEYLQANPRFIKLLTNTYGINVAVAMSSGLQLSDEDYDNIVVWTIISLQYPAVADELANNPDLISAFLSEENLENSPALNSQLKHDDLIHLLGGYVGNGTELKKEIVRALTGQTPD
jgi:hypothetical protein